MVMMLFASSRTRSRSRSRSRKSCSVLTLLLLNVVVVAVLVLSTFSFSFSFSFVVSSSSSTDAGEVLSEEEVVVVVVTSAAAAAAAATVESNVDESSPNTCASGGAGAGAGALDCEENDNSNSIEKRIAEARARAGEKKHNDDGDEYHGDDDDDDDDEYPYVSVYEQNEKHKDKNEYLESKPLLETITQTDNEEQKKQYEIYKDFLPNFNNGGIIVFFHLYKTGGSSVTELIVDLKAEQEDELINDENNGCVVEVDEDDEDNTSSLNTKNTNPDCQSRVVFINNRESISQDDIDKSIWLVEYKKKVVVYNFHVEFPSTMYPTLVEAEPILKKWSLTAKEKNISYFSTTLVREPIGHALSFFNFFHVAIADEDWSPFQGDMDPTEDNFLKTYVPNRLCHIMYDDAHSILEAPDYALRDGLVNDLHHFMDVVEYNRRNEPSYCNITKVREILYDSNIFNYIGVTEKLSTHILPMFTYLVFGDASWGLNTSIKKKVDTFYDNEEDIKLEIKPLKKYDLSDETKQKVLTESNLDQQLYEEILEKFNHWPKYEEI